MMEFDENVYAEVVFDGEKTHIPARMGTPRDDQMQGTELEKLIELAGRVCYDSLGKGRSSDAYHKHIGDVGHGSVWEHANFTIEFAHKSQRSDYYLEPYLAHELFTLCMNRPGLWVERCNSNVVRVTLNVRAAVEWARFHGSDAWPLGANRYTAQWMIEVVQHCLSVIVPQIRREATPSPVQGDYSLFVEPTQPEEKWVSLLLGCSRGCSHEQVRHKWRTAVSQRSTRYVDERDSPWVAHPLWTRWQREVAGEELVRKMAQAAQNAVGQCRSLYELQVDALQGWLESQGVDKHTARKQARGAARGFLGNALHTEMIFSASVAQWRRMIDMRCSLAADAEIRVLYGHVVRALQTTKWKDDFADIRLVPSPDGIGEVVAIEGTSR